MASSQRAIPMRRRPDLQVLRMDNHADGGWTVKDPLTLEYHVLEPAQYAVLQRLDGQTSLQVLERDVNREFPSHAWTFDGLQKLIVDLHGKGLVVSDRPGQEETFRQRRWQRHWQNCKSLPLRLLSMKLPGWNAASTLDALLPWVRWIYHPVAIGLATLLVVSSWLLILVEFAEFRRRLPDFQQFFGWSNLGWMWGTIAITKILHEFGHGLACHYYGRRCHEMGVMIMIFTPTLYCDATDAWMLSQRWPRIWISAGGILVELVIAAIATYVWWFSQPGVVHHMALNVIFVCAVTTVVFNANPLMKYDGYYMLSDWLGIANLRQKADRILDRFLARWLFGYTLLPDPLVPQHSQFWLGTYGLAATTYGWFVSGSIMLFLYAWLKPYQLQSVGITLAVVSLSGLVVSLVARGWRIGRSTREKERRWGRMLLAWLGVVVIVASILSIRIPWFIEAAALVEPVNGVEIMNSVSGRVRTILVHPGAEVRAGDVLLELENEELDDRVRELQAEISRQHATVAAARDRKDRSEHAVVLEHLKALEERLAEARAQQRQLQIKAPIAGRVIGAPPRLDQPENEGKKLQPWLGTPLDEQNLGAWLEVRTPIATIAPGAALQATVYLPQAYRNQVEIGDAVGLKFDSLPDVVYRGTLTDFSREHADTAPVALSNKAGGTLATVTRSDQQEELQELAYRGEVTFDDREGLLKTGMRGRARVIVSDHTVAWWVMQTIRRTFRFRL